MYRTCRICKDPSGAHIKEDINMKRPVTAAIAGLGNRGNDIYAHYQLVAPEEMKVVAVADPVAGKREAAREEYGVAPEKAEARRYPGDSDPGQTACGPGGGGD